MKLKEVSEKGGLKLNNQKTKIMASDPTPSRQIDGETVRDFRFWGTPKSLQKVTATMKKMLTSWKESYNQPAAATTAKSLQSCPTLCDLVDGIPPGSTIPGILQARTVEWVAISFSNAWKWKMKVESLSRVQLLVTPWTAAHQAPSSMGFSRQDRPR